MYVVFNFKLDMTLVMATMVVEEEWISDYHSLKCWAATLLMYSSESKFLHSSSITEKQTIFLRRGIKGNEEICYSILSGQSFLVNYIN